MGLKYIFRLTTFLGSLIARILFQPVEEMSRVYFARTLASFNSSNITQAFSETKNDEKLAEQVKKSQAGQACLRRTAQILSSILVAQAGAGVLLYGFGPPFLPLLLRVGLPQRYLVTSAPELMQAWIWYIPILAINGVLEAFVSSVATSSDIHRQSRYD
jgi:oligosaccharide translocation protein RFT1